MLGGGPRRVNGAEAPSGADVQRNLMWLTGAVSSSTSQIALEDAMPKTRRLRGLAAMSAATLATVAAGSTVSADDHVGCITCPVGQPGQIWKLDKFEGLHAFDKIDALFGKLETPGLDEAFDKLGEKF